MSQFLRLFACFIFSVCSFQAWAKTTTELAPTCHDFTGSWEGVCKFEDGTISTNKSYLYLAISEDCSTLSFNGVSNVTPHPLYLIYLHGRQVTIDLVDYNTHLIQKSRSSFVNSEKTIIESQIEFTETYLPDNSLQDQYNSTQTISLTHPGLEVKSDFNSVYGSSKQLCYYEKID